MDGSSLAECVLPHAVSVARAFDARVTLLQVLDQTYLSEPTRPVDPLDWHIKKAESISYLNGLTAHLEEQGLSVDTVLLEGQAAEQIVEFANTRGVDLLLLSSHGRSGLSGWNVSSTVQKVIMAVRTSIMIIRAYQLETADLTGVRYERILVPLDGSQRAECALPLTMGLGRYYEAQLTLAHVVKQPEIPRQVPPTPEEVELVERITARNREEASRQLEQLQARLQGNVQIRLLTGQSVPVTLHELVQQEKVDLVILCAHGHGGQVRWPYASLPISFIAYGTTPLLVVQDSSADQIEPTEAELVAKEYKGH
jgi:nucleotide-binding universal stress UspA family protein